MRDHPAGHTVPRTVPWQDRFYGSYVSSGQAGVVGSNPEVVFRPRKAYIERVIADHLPQERSARIIDLGCGHGCFLYFLSRAGYQNATGIDTSIEQVDAARELGVSTAACGDAYERLSGLPADSMDAVIAFDVLEHFERQELLDYVDHIFRVLVPGGICLAHVPNAEGLQGMRIRFGDMTHQLAFTSSSARQLFQCVGFSQVECYEERPVVHGATSLVRRVIWDAGTLPLRLLCAAETGMLHPILSQNLLVRVTK